ncbi:DUF4392 domain-containing protein [bacterium]|nr:DUF4392 domain-containing protein [candidate division CSSED10-310 bacterium]
MIAELTFEGDPRGTYTLRNISGKIPYRAAAEHVIRTPGTVFVLTGFYIPEAGTIETDGLTGSWTLFSVLTALGKEVYIPFDAHSDVALRALFPENRLIPFPVSPIETAATRAREILDRYRPGSVIAVERPGPNHDGRCITARGIDITESVAPMDQLFSPASLTIGIGDGGNELGMGCLAAHHETLLRNQPVCYVPADFTLLGATSDFAAYGLAAALAAISRNRVFPDPETIVSRLDMLQRLGIVDGMTCVATASIDGFSRETIARKATQFHTLVDRIIRAGEAVDDCIRDTESQYDIVTMSVLPRCHPDTLDIILDGTVLLKTQCRHLVDAVRQRGLTVQTPPTILSDPECTHPAIGWILVPTAPIDLLDHPGGHCTTQISEQDTWVRILWQSGPWLLVQTPDLALGWTRSLPGFTTETTPVQPGPNPSHHPNPSPHPMPSHPPWASIRRPPLNALSVHTISLAGLQASADTLLGSPYRWGGRMPDGLDCSAFIQRVFASQDLLLPRNSRDQRACGIRVPFDNHGPGDVVFAVGRIKTVHHVALCLPGDTVQHACLATGRVLRETMDAFLEKYRMIGIRRFARIA